MEAQGRRVQERGVTGTVTGRYAVAVGTACLALALKLILGDYLAPPYILFFAAVMLSAMLGGLGPGLVATLVSAGLVYVFLFEPRFTLRLDHPRDLAGLAVFVVIGGAVSAIADQRRKAEDRARESESRLLLAVRGGGLGLWDWDLRSGRCKYNERWAAMLGHELDEIEENGSSWESRIHPDDRTRIQPILEANMRGKADSWAWEQRLRHKDGHWVWVLGAGAVVERAPDGTPLRAAGTHLDISVQKQAEAALRSSEEHFRLLVSSLPIPLSFNNSDQEIVTLNPKFTEVLGYTQADIPDVATWFRKAYPDEAYRAVVASIWGEQLRKAVERGSDIRPEEYRVTCKDGRVRTMSISGTPVGKDLLVTMLDVTEGRAMQAKLALASRLAAIGTLVTGVAHEINNPLAAIMAGTGTATEDVAELQGILRGGSSPDPERLACRAAEVQQMLGDVTSSAQRIAGIVKDLSVFGRPDQDRRPTRLNDAIQKSLGWLPPFVAERAVIRVEVEEAPEAMASESQIAQVVVNLVENAALAIPDGRKGNVRIRLGRGLPEMVRLEVSDDGRGIAPELIERIFEPFFTTRPQGKGTGLGLSICNAIVTAHGGTLTVKSEVGRGTTFRVELPEVAHEASPRSAAEPVVEC
jgi:PAS domain S-box-containing protein